MGWRLRVSSNSGAAQSVQFHVNTIALPFDLFQRGAQVLEDSGHEGERHFPYRLTLVPS